MLAIAVNALYTTLRKRGTTRQLARAIVSSTACALLLIPALLWSSLRLGVEQAALSALEIGLMLLYVALFGWIFPVSVTTVYCLFTQPRDSYTAGRLPRQRRRTTRTSAVVMGSNPPRRQSNVPAPFVYNADLPWGWLEYRNGKFLGQELALKRMLITLGRDEENEVELDDDTISRYHAELSWDKGQVYVTDCGSLNGVRLNGRRIRSATLVKNGDLLDIGAHRFLMKYAQQPADLDGLDDPLLPQLRRTSLAKNEANPAPLEGGRIDKPLSAPTVALSHDPETFPAPERTLTEGEIDIAGQETAELMRRMPDPSPFNLPLPLRLPSKPRD